MLLSPETDAPTDVDLVHAARRGETAALGLLIARHRAAMLAVATRILRHRADAEDAVQEAAVVALLHIDGLRAPSAVGPWLRTVTRNASLARLRARVDLPADSGVLTAVGSTEPDPAELLDELATRDWVWTALAELPSEQRLVIVLRHLTGLTAYQDIAEALRVPVGTVRSRLAAARRKLAAALLATADSAHDDVAELTRARRQEAVESLAAAQRGAMAGALAEYWAPDLASSWPSGRMTTGHDSVVRAVESNMADGVRHRLVDVIAGGGLVLWDMDLLSPPEAPFHCPPGALWVLQVDGGQVRRARMLHRPRAHRA
ncbi:RNA polymerase sigma factor [Promicromonospora sp. NFX87]|uniref:RNA polymerase sigma factor n=1 Tax=Promicromonospora sp. NFX87 TaxID=3402691 RepID=UPI003AFA1410